MNEFQIKKYVQISHSVGLQLHCCGRSSWYTNSYIRAIVCLTLFTSIFTSNLEPRRFDGISVSHLSALRESKAIHIGKLLNVTP